MTSRRSDPYTLKEFAVQVERVTDDSSEPTPGTEDVFGDDAPAAMREFRRRTGLDAEAVAFVFMGLIVGTRMAEARRDG